jgi:hypothetical protein
MSTTVTNAEHESACCPNFDLVQNVQWSGNLASGQQAFEECQEGEIAGCDLVGESPDVVPVVADYQGVGGEAHIQTCT